MSPTQEHPDERISQALTRWADQLAEGRSWSEVEDEIIRSCEGRVDLLTQLLIHAETQSSPPASRRLAHRSPRMHASRLCGRLQRRPRSPFSARRRTLCSLVQAGRGVRR
jgi:hypothetical protein